MILLCLTPAPKLQADPATRLPAAIRMGRGTHPTFVDFNLVV